MKHPEILVLWVFDKLNSRYSILKELSEVMKYELMHKQKDFEHKMNFRQGNRVKCYTWAVSAIDHFSFVSFSKHFSAQEF